MVLLIHVKSSTFYKHHQAYVIKNNNISAIRSSTFTSVLGKDVYFGFPSPILEENLDYFHS